MIQVARTDTSILGRWWWTVDRWTLAALIVLMGFGAVLIMAVSPAAAHRINGLASFQLAERQMVFLVLALSLMISVGHRTGLFDTMATLEPASSREIAEQAGHRPPR